ncbi:MAG: TlpA family protein disulfide reductase [Bacteroidales bacterium]|nr:TlpA family protein disulfide reductase [Bacteroidales bacterium]
MKKLITLLVCLLTIGSAMAQNTNSDEAKRVLRLSREKCRSIKQGHYVMEHKKKFMSDKDTTTNQYTCDFRKMRRDRLFGMVFAMQYNDQDNPERIGYTLYTGKELVEYFDSTGTIMSCKKWKDRIKDISDDYIFYRAFTHRNNYPFPDKRQLSDNNYTYSISDTMLDNKPCHLVDYNIRNMGTAGFNIQIIRYEVKLWIEKQSLLPIQYTIEFDNVDQADTLYQYDCFKLLSFDTAIDESKLTLASIPANVKLKDYEPYKEPEPLAEGSPAPDWSLASLTGDTVRLADLRGKVVLLDFFYKSCGPCCAAMPFLQSIHEKYRDQGVVLLGVDPYDDPEKDKMADFTAKRNITYTVLFSNLELPQTYHVSTYPTLFFIDRDGKIAKVHRGYHQTMEASIEEQLQKMLE